MNGKLRQRILVALTAVFCLLPLTAYAAVQTFTATDGYTITE